MGKYRIPALFKGLDDSENMPFVHRDGVISNLDISEGEQMPGVKTVQGENGETFLRIRRPGRCLYCGGKCTSNPAIVAKGQRAKRVKLEICFCETKPWIDRAFGRFAKRLRGWSYGGQNNRVGRVCPVCRSSNVRILGPDEPWGGLYQGYFKCGTCGFKEEKPV